LHIDEWHHITESIKLKQGKIAPGLSGAEIGFHTILAFLSFFFNLIYIYKFLAPIWAVFSALILFWVVRKKTSDFKHSFYIALFAMISFASIKSNVNILGLWFFTPLTFAIPFIFLYIYYFTEGLEKNNKKFILISLIIMLGLLFIHSVSVLFAVPFLIIYCLVNFKNTKKNYKTLLLFLLIPVLGLLFFKFITKIPFSKLFQEIGNALLFRLGWGVLELQNSFLELYSIIGLLLAVFGIILIFAFKILRKRFLIYALWPITVFVYIIIFRIFEISFLSPYQRNLYYFTIALPFLTSLGLFYALKFIKGFVNNKKAFKVLKIILIIIILILMFYSYFVIPKNILLYKTVDEDGIAALRFLKDLPDGKVMSPMMMSPAVFSISNHEPIATLFFYGNRTIVEDFYLSKGCEIKNNILKQNKIRYVLSQGFHINCFWNLIYYKNKTYIYEIEN
jgi:hypothetical protein